MWVNVLLLAYVGAFAVLCGAVPAFMFCRGRTRAIAGALCVGAFAVLCATAGAVLLAYGHTATALFAGRVLALCAGCVVLFAAVHCAAMAWLARAYPATRCAVR